MNVHLDTHVALWLAAGEKKRLRTAKASLLKQSLFLSPFVIVEMEVLREINRIRVPVDDILEVLSESFGVEETSGDCGEVAEHARQLGWTRDPFDRLIVAHALACRATLLTADETILKHCTRARWA
ncbi:MAG: PIN domain-containing protein [Polyangiaceae bacterium]|nr:PIN domain-containing protein [Polyangiaceae bacterium]